EPLARRRIRKLISAHQDVEIVGECAEGRAAVADIRRLRPDLVFLDIQMPELDGFGVIREVGPDRMPAVVFVTAHDKHALRGFEVHALDYLLKPFDAKRLAAAVDIARRRCSKEEGTEVPWRRRLTELVESLEARRRYPDHILVKSDGRVFVLPLQD